MNAEQVRRLCDILGLGQALGEPTPVTGGFLHRMWRLETERGVFAVKEGALQSVSGQASLGTLGAARRAAAGERIAYALAALGIPAVVALCAESNPLLALDPTLDPVIGLGGPGHLMVLVYPWIEGRPLPAKPADPTSAARIGAVLARIHTLPSPMVRDLPGSWVPPTVDLDQLLLLARDAERLGLAWAPDLRGLRPDMALWYARYRQVLPDLYHHQVLSHRDLNQKNVLWPDAQTPLLIDWESAGMINPTVELANVALNWSGVTVGEPDSTAFAAMVAAYRDHGGRVTDEPRDALYAVLVNWLAWLRHAAGEVVRRHRAITELRSRPELAPVARRLDQQRMQAATAQHTEQIARFDHEAVNTLATVARIAANLDLYASWLAK